MNTRFIHQLAQLLECAEAPAAIVLLGAIARVGYLLLIAHQGFMSDAASYVAMATDIAQGKHFIPFWPPGVPLYLALVQHVAGASTLAVRLSMLVFYFGLSAALYQLAIALTGKRFAGSLALFPLAFAPEMVCATLEPMTEIPAAMFLTLVAVFLLRSRSLGYGAAVALGICLGSLALLRPASLLLLVAVPVYALWRSRKILLGVIPFVVGTAIVLVWIATVQHETGRFVVINTANAKNIYLGNNPNTPLYRTWWLGSHHELENAALPVAPLPNTDPITLDAEYSAIARAYIAQHPDLFLLRTVNRVCVFFAFNTFTGAYLTQDYGFPGKAGLLIIAIDAILYATIGLGAILFVATRIRSDKNYTDVIVMMALCLAYALPYFFAFSHPRYHVPIEPVMMAFFAAFFSEFNTEGGATRILLHQRRFAIAMAVALFLVIQVEFFVIAGRGHA